MATAINSARGTEIKSAEIKLETNVPQTFALKFSTGKAVGQWGNTMFTAVDSRRIFLNAEDASEFEHALSDMRIQPAEFIRVTRVKHGGRGGGFSIRVERVEDEPVSRTEALLEKSVEMARNRTGAAPASTESKTAPASTTPEGTVLPNGNMQITPAAVRICSTMCALIDSMTEAKAYAQRKGIDLTNEDLRCLVTTAFIRDSQSGGR